MIAGYTQRIMDDLSSKGETVVRFHICHTMDSDERRKAEIRARSRIMNAANRLRLKVSTQVDVDQTGPFVYGYLVPTRADDANLLRELVMEHDQALNDLAGPQPRRTALYYQAIDRLEKSRGRR